MSIAGGEVDLLNKTFTSFDEGILRDSIQNSVEKPKSRDGSSMFKRNPLRSHLSEMTQQPHSQNQKSRNGGRRNLTLTSKSLAEHFNPA